MHKIPPLTNACSARGADMGRPDHLPEDFSGTAWVCSVPIQDGYDPGGAYWGGPPNLWRIYAPAGEEDDGVDGFFRCSDTALADVLQEAKTYLPEADIQFAGLQVDDVVQGFFEALEFVEDEELEGGENPDEASKALATQAIEKFLQLAGERNLLGDWCDSQEFGQKLYLDFKGCGTGFYDEPEHRPLSELVKEVMGFGEQINVYRNEADGTYSIEGRLLK